LSPPHGSGRRRKAAAGWLGLCLLIGGCLSLDPAARYQTPVVAEIAISTTEGDPPLHVVVSGRNSTSLNGPIVRYLWDFAGQASSEDVVAEHTFYEPGRYAITLTVFDAAGQQAKARVYVRVHGGAVTAVISAEPLSGPAPLTVRFDGTQSSASDDTILDYYWDFGDGTRSRESAPLHVYATPGTYTVRLRVVSAGGVEDSTEETITVGAAPGGASLQFDGSQFATLPVADATALTDLTFEAWCKPQAEGGTLVSFGVPNVRLDVLPASGSLLLSVAGQVYSADAPLSAERWQHVALSISADGDEASDPNSAADPNAPADPNTPNEPKAPAEPNVPAEPNEPAGSARLYLDGTLVAAFELGIGPVNIPLLTLGSGLRGKISGVRLWAGSPDDGQDDTGAGAGGTLLGDWPLSAGSGQLLENTAGGESGVLGLSSEPESSDPAWSADSP